jgi:hypothetical protein
MRANTVPMGTIFLGTIFNNRTYAGTHLHITNHHRRLSQLVCKLQDHLPNRVQVGRKHPVSRRSCGCFDGVQ